MELQRHDSIVRFQLAGTLYLKNAIQILTQKDGLGLKAYALTPDQWKLGGHLVPILEV